MAEGQQVVAVYIAWPPSKWQLLAQHDRVAGGSCVYGREMHMWAHGEGVHGTLSAWKACAGVEGETASVATP
eukprot:483569-Pelagomonas_calceolata.AAC.10